MILVKKNILAKLLEYEVARFLIVGGTTVLIDLICYFILIYIGFDTFLSKGISFSVGTVFAYFANRNYTFQSSMGGFFRFTVFTLLYLSTLVVNVASNEIVLKLTIHDKWLLNDSIFNCYFSICYFKFYRDEIHSF